MCIYMHVYAYATGFHRPKPEVGQTGPPLETTAALRARPPCHGGGWAHCERTGRPAVRVRRRRQAGSDDKGGGAPDAAGDGRLDELGGLRRLGAEHLLVAAAPPVGRTPVGAMGRFGGRTRDGHWNAPCNRRASVLAASKGKCRTNWSNIAAYWGMPAEGSAEGHMRDGSKG